MAQRVPQPHAGLRLAAGAGRQRERGDERVEQRLSHDLAEEPGEGDREGEHRQHQARGRGSAHGRQPAEAGGEHEDQHHADPEVRQRGRHDLDARADRRGDPARARGDEGEAEREDPRHGEREHGQQQRARQLPREHRDDVLAQRVRPAEVALREAPQLREVLHEERLVEPVLGAHRGDGLGRRLRAGAAEDRLRRVSRDQPHREERHGRDRPEHEDRAADPGPDGAEERGSTGAGRADGAAAPHRASQVSYIVGVATEGSARSPWTAVPCRKWFCWS